MKKNLKKVFLIIVLIVIFVIIVFIANNASKGKKELNVKSSGSTIIEKVAQTEKDNETETTIVTERKILPVTEIKLDDGIKYSVTEEVVKPDIVLKDNYYDTQIADFNLNFDEYEGKTVEIDGFYFENKDYTFVGRYSTSNICPTCPTGYSFFEYEWYGDKKLNLIDSDSWIKVVGTLKRGNDGEEYYYIEANSIEIMNQRGLETVSN